MTAAGPVRLQTPDWLASLLHERGVQTAPGTDPAPERQRAKLWDFIDSVYCSVIGTCLTTGKLRRVMGKALSADVSHLSDHDLHPCAIGL